MRRTYNGKTPYSLHLNIKDLDLVANCPDPVSFLEPWPVIHILTEQTVQVGL